jgi:pimeloyl-ACP methyl ester carboxylesterase
MSGDSISIAGPDRPPRLARWGAVLAAAAVVLLQVPPAARADDFACSACAHDYITQMWHIDGHPLFSNPKLINEHCTAIEYPVPFFSVSADGTQVSEFEIDRVKIDSGFCSTTVDPYQWPEVHFIDQFGANIADPDEATYGVIEVVEQRSDHVKFSYTNPTKGPPADKQSRTITVGIRYKDSDQSDRLELVATFQIHVYRLPVVMTHGLWADRGSFEAMEQAFTSPPALYPKSLVYRVDYKATNAAAFVTNDRDVRAVEQGTYKLFDQAATDGKIAAGKVNLVGHSMGGILSRLFTQGPYYHHEVFRLITCNTPHSGSQMANLLLDEVWDPNGALCAGLEKAGQGACYQGAVCDLNVYSLAVHNLLNNPSTYPSDVQVHAIGTVYDILDSVPGGSITQFLRSSWPELVALTAPSCSVPDLVSDVFNGDDADFIVALTSQVGGLQQELTSVFPGQRHDGSVANPAVIDEVSALLDQPTPNSVFTLAGFNPASLSYFSPSRCASPDVGINPGRSAACATANHAQALTASAARAASSLMITSPADGSPLTGGQGFSVAVVGDSGIASILLLLSAPGGDVYLAKLPGPSAVFDLEVPSDLVGERALTALGIDANGAAVATSNTVELEIDTSATLQSISVYPASVYLSPGSAESLEITGAYDDGMSRDLSDLSGLTFDFAEGHASATAQNAVTLNDATDDSFTVTYQGVTSPSVPIHMLPPLPSPQRRIRRHLAAAP